MSRLSKRSMNFTEKETDRLMNLCIRFRHIVNSKKSDNHMNSLKNDAWKMIALEYNNGLNERIRDAETLKCRYKNVRSGKGYEKYRERMESDYGLPVPMLDINHEHVNVKKERESEQEVTDAEEAEANELLSNNDPLDEFDRISEDKPLLKRLASTAEPESLYDSELSHSSVAPAPMVNNVSTNKIVNNSATATKFRVISHEAYRKTHAYKKSTSTPHNGNIIYDLDSHSDQEFSDIESVNKNAFSNSTTASTSKIGKMTKNSPRATKFSTIRNNSRLNNNKLRTTNNKPTSKPLQQYAPQITTDKWQQLAEEKLLFVQEKRQQQRIMHAVLLKQLKAEFDLKMEFMKEEFQLKKQRLELELLNLEQKNNNDCETN